MALDGIMFEGAPVKVRRPSDYNPLVAATVRLTTGFADGLKGPDRIFVGGLPYYFTEAQISKLLESFGPLRGVDLVKARETENLKGYAFCVYHNLSVTNIACATLNGIKMGDKTLTVRCANQGTTQPKLEQENILLHAQQQMALQRLMLQPATLATKVLCLTQVVSPDKLKDDEDYEDILEGMMRQEGEKHEVLYRFDDSHLKLQQELKERIEKVKEKFSMGGVFTSESEFSEEMMDIRKSLSLSMGRWCF